MPWLTLLCVACAAEPLANVKCLCILQAVPNHTRALSRAATCHLRMGGFAEAQVFIDALREQPQAQAEAAACQQSKDALQQAVQQVNPSAPLSLSQHDELAEMGCQAQVLACCSRTALAVALHDTDWHCRPAPHLCKQMLMLR